MDITGFLSGLMAAVAGLSAFGAVAQPMTAVTQLGWLRNGEYAPIMMAEAKGYFDRAESWRVSHPPRTPAVADELNDFRAEVAAALARPGSSKSK